MSVDTCRVRWETNDEICQSGYAIVSESVFTDSTSLFGPQTTHPGNKCETCGLPDSACNGHAGYFDLPYYIVSFLHENIVSKLSQLACPHCLKLSHGPSLLSQIMTEKKYQQYKWVTYDDKPLTASYNSIRVLDTIKCTRCGEDFDRLNPIWGSELVGLESSVFLLGFYRGDEFISTMQLYDFLSSIHRSEFRQFNMCMYDTSPHPAEFIRQYIKVTPYCIRRRLGSQRRQAEQLASLTAGYKFMFKSRNAILSIMVDKNALDHTDKREIVLREAAKIAAKQASLTVAIDSDVPVIKKVIDDKRKVAATSSSSLISNMSGKKGFVRDQMGSVRTIVSNRAVLGGFMEEPVGTCGTPLAAARSMSVPVRVTDRNIEQLKWIVSLGSNSYPGASAVTRRSGITKYIRSDDHARNLATNLVVGDIVHRRPFSGDICFDLRYPSLKPEAFGFRVMQIHETNQVMQTFADMYGPNADIDGDMVYQMIPHSIRATMDLMFNLNPLRRIYSSGGDGFGFPARTDVATGARLVAHFINRKVSDIASARLEQMLFMLPKYIKSFENLTVSDVDIKKYIGVVDSLGQRITIDKDATFKDVLDTIMPEISITLPHIKVRKGSILEGAITDKDLGKSSKIIRYIYEQAGRFQTMLWYDNMRRFTVELAKMFGMSIPLHFYVPIPKVKNLIIDRMEKFGKILNVSRPLVKGGLVPQVGQTVYDMIAQVSSEHIGSLHIGDIRQLIKDSVPKGIMEHSMITTTKTMSSLIMATGGYGLVEFPFSSPTGVVASATVNEGRTHIAFRYGECTPRSCGFSPESYSEGLSPVVSMFLGESNIFTLNNRVNAVADPGSKNKQTSKVAGDAVAGYLNQVVYDTMIADFSYGDLHAEPDAIATVDAPYLNMTLEEFKEVYTKGLPDKEAQPIIEAYHKTIRRMRGLTLSMRTPMTGQGDRVDSHNIDPVVGMAFDIYAVMDRFVDSDSSAGPKIKSVDELIEKYRSILYGPDVNQTYSHTYTFAVSSAMIDNLRIILSPNIMESRGIPKKAFPYVYGAVYHRLLETKLQAGSAVGIRSALALTANLVQLFLDAIHHHAEYGSGGVRTVSQPGSDRFSYLMTEPKKRNKHGDEDHKAIIRVVPSDPSSKASAELILQRYDSLMSSEIIDSMPRVIIRPFATARNKKELGKMVGIDDIDTYTFSSDSFNVSPVALIIRLTTPTAIDIAPFFIGSNRVAMTAAKSRDVILFFEPNTQRLDVQKFASELVSGRELKGTGDFFNGTVTTTASVGGDEYYVVLFNTLVDTTQKDAHIINMLHDPLVDEDMTTIDIVTWHAEWFGIDSAMKLRADELIAMARRTGEFSVLPIRIFHLFASMMCMMGASLQVAPSDIEHMPHSFVEVLNGDNVVEALRRATVNTIEGSARQNIGSVVSGALGKFGSGFSDVAFLHSYSYSKDVLSELEQLLG